MMLVYYIVINLVGYCVMWLDKQKAKKQAYRISEKELWLIALCFGAFGMTLAMWQFRHKSRTWYFQYGLPLLTLIQGICLIYMKVG